MSTTRQTNNVRVLKALRQGPVRASEWSDFTAPDGGVPIMRLAARISELRNAGWAIERTGTHNKMAVYELSTPATKKAA